MKLLAISMFIVGALAGQEKTDSTFKMYFPLINKDRLASHLYFIASDLMEGRETSARGQKLTAAYLANQYRQMGVQPMGTMQSDDLLSPNPYFQPFSVSRRAKPNSRLEVHSWSSLLIASSLSMDHQDELAYFLSGGPKDVEAPVVFAGYGITADSLKYNDYKSLASGKISIDGKWLMILEDEPLQNDSTSLLPTSSHRFSTWSRSYLSKVGAALKYGKPAGILIISDRSPRQPLSFKDQVTQSLRQFDAIGRPVLESELLTPLSPPVYAISSTFADSILTKSGHTSASLQQGINKSLKPIVLDLKNVTVSASGEKLEALETENVLGFIEGSDPILKNEVMVLSAHYDHLGINRNMKGDQIFNGAADDGSGTAAVLVMAQAFAQARNAGNGPKRSILFLNTSGEEKGCLGSRFFASVQPVIPIDRMVANINLDGAGGIDLGHPTKSENYIYLVSSPVLSPSLVKISDSMNRMIADGLEVTPHANRLIPYLYYSTGLTEHYHKVSDEPSTIDYDHLARVTRLAFATAWTVANQPALNLPDRSKFRIKGFTCPPCPYNCDDLKLDKNGACPVCGMMLEAVIEKN